MFATFLNAFAPTPPRGLPVVAPPSIPCRNENIENIKTMATALNARDAVVEEVMPQIMDAVSKLMYSVDTDPLIPNCLNVLMLKNEGDDNFTRLITDLQESKTVAMHCTASIEAAIKLFNIKKFDILISTDTFIGKVGSCISEKIEKDGYTLPILTFSDGTLTETVSIKSCKHVYAVLDYETGNNSKAVEVACQQVYLRFMEKTSIRRYSEEIVKLIGAVERIKCKMET